MVHRRDRAARLGDVARLAARETADRFPTGVGHDLVYLPDFAALLEDEATGREFLPGELAIAQAMPDGRPFLAACWAAKRAAAKAFCDLAAALGEAADGLRSPRNYEVAHRAGTVIPVLVLHERARVFLDEIARGAETSVSMSTTEERDYAAAFVVVSRVPAPSARMVA